MEIRAEQEDDFKQIYDVVEKAFQTEENGQTKQQELVSELRNSDSYIPELSLVAIADDKIVGHIMFIRVIVSDRPCLALASLAVLDNYRNKHIGSSLMEYGNIIAKNMGFDYIIVPGESEFYSRLGYADIKKPKAKLPFESETYMALQLTE